jgi:hypothetical protein
LYAIIPVLFVGAHLVDSKKSKDVPEPTPVVSIYEGKDLEGMASK